MKPVALLVLVPLLSTPLGLGNDAELVHAPPAGTARTLAVELEGRLTGGELEVVMDGNEVPASYLPELELEVHERRLFELFERAEEGGWLRRYESLVWTNSGSIGIVSDEGDETHPWSAEGRSPLEGREVRFRAAGAGHEGAFADGKDSAVGLPERIGAALDGRELLPEAAVAPGESWTIDGAGLGFLFEPGGDLAWELPPEAAAELLPEIRSRSVSGALELTLTELEDGKACSSVVGRLVRTTVQPGDLSRVPYVDGTATDTVSETWELEGELVWSIDERQLLSLDLEGDIASVTRTERDPGQPGMSYVGRFSASGSQSLSIRSTRVGAAEGRR